MAGRILKTILIVSGCLFLTLFLLCFTTAPFWTWYRLSTKYAGIHRPPDVIIVLGGGGMPSESGLMRCWYGAKAATYYNRSGVIVALPGDTTDSMSSVNRMKRELVLRGVESERIRVEDAGTNTRSQALNIYSLLILNPKLNDILHPRAGTSQPTSPIFHGPSYGQPKPAVIAHTQPGILIITSPEHLCRAVQTFKKAGFRKVDGLPAFEIAIESGLLFDDRLIGGRKWMPAIGKNLTLRYQFWTQLHYEELVIREWLAMAYYKMNGWM